MSKKDELICIVSGYPSPARPTFMAFVKEIAHGFARSGKNVAVVSPTPFPRCLDRKGYPCVEDFFSTSTGGRVTVFRPCSISFSNIPCRPWMGILNPERIAIACDLYAVTRTLKKHNLRPTVFYGHFIRNGIVSTGAAKALGGRSFIGVGESGFSFATTIGVSYCQKRLQDVAAFIPNANHLVPLLEDLFNIPLDKMHVLPNGVDLSLFKPQDKLAARRKYRIPQDDFVVGSTGHFIYRKGINRVAEAIRDLDGVVGIFAGRGDLPPEGSNVLFKDLVPHDELPGFYSACDVFVLPTLSEGCCNAITEAMACGVPVISSDNKYVDDQLDESCSLRVDPLNVSAIKNAIVRLKMDTDLRKCLAVGAFRRAQLFSIDLRIKKILTLFQACCKEEKSK